MPTSQNARKVLTRASDKDGLPMSFGLRADELLDHAAQGDALREHVKMAIACQPSDVEVLIALRWASQKLVEASEACRELVEANRKSIESDEPKSVDKA